MKLKFDTNYIANIEKLVYQGWGLSKIDNIKVFVPGAIPQDKVTIKIIKNKRRYAVGKIIDFIEKSPLRKRELCPYSSQCGGCQMIDIEYQEQLNIKETILEDSFKQFFPEILEHKKPITPAKSNIYYRNKMEFSFGRDENNQIYSGLKKRGQFDQVVNCQKCFLLSEESNEIRAFICDKLNQKNLSIWDYHNHTGFLRYLTIRHSKTFDKYMINFIVSENNPSHLSSIASELQQQFPNVSSILMSVNSQHGDSAFSPISMVLGGKNYLQEKIDNLIFSISPFSFFQTNTEQMITLYQNIAKINQEYAVTQPNPTQLIMDLYCGTGTIGLFLSSLAQNIIGIEENQSSTNDADSNAKNNNISNATFINGRVKNILKFQKFSPDCVIVDPPRSGMVPKALKRMAELKAKQVIYVSCNPTTLLRDLKELSTLGYKVTNIQPVDMFPNTFHLECITSLSYQ
jgi:23S rRNA (uracil1939-C5)-methyltransferase